MLRATQHLSFLFALITPLNWFEHIDSLRCDLARSLALPSILPPMQSKPETLLPLGKHDTEKAKAIIAMGYPQVEPVLYELLACMQDMNWPIAQVVQPFLAKIGAPLAPHIRQVLATDDEVWKSWVLQWVVSGSSELTSSLTPELRKLAVSPTAGERQEGLDVIAKELLGS